MSKTNSETGARIDFTDLYSFLESAATFKDKKALILKAMRKVAAPTAAAFKARYKPKAGKGETGNLYRSLGVWAGVTRSRGFMALAGARQYGRYKGYLAHLYENGTKERFTKNGLSRGKMPAANNWSGIKASKTNKTETLKTELVKVFERHINNKSKKYG